MVEFNGGPAPQIEQANGYEIWRPQGAVTADIQPGETVENVLVDHTGQDILSFRARQVADWTLRNVGMDGVPGIGKDDYAFLARLSAPAGSSGTVENCYFPGWGTSLGGIWVRASHEGELYIRNSYFGGFGNNSVYGSGPGKRGSTGPVIIENCFSDSSTTGNFRIGTPGSRIRDSLVVIDDENCQRGGYPGTGIYTPRPVWVSHHPDQRAENVHVVVNPDDCNPGPGAFQTRWCTDCGDGSGGSRCELTLSGCHINQAAIDAGYPVFFKWNGGGDVVENEVFSGQNTVAEIGRNPTVSVLGDGVPLDAEMSAQGSLGLPDISAAPPEDGGGTGPPTEAGIDPVVIAALAAAGVGYAVWKRTRSDGS